MLLVKNLNHKSLHTVLFQRLSVIVTDLVLALGAYLCCRSLNLKLQTSDITKAVPLLVLANAGLFIVDHIHFQYNGFLLGILLASIGSKYKKIVSIQIYTHVFNFKIYNVCILIPKAMMAQQYLISSLLFAILLNLKHIYLYCAPAYFIYLLTTFCRQPGSILMGLSLKRIFVLGVLVLTVFAASFGPFIQIGQLVTVLQRLFPFKR